MATTPASSYTEKKMKSAELKSIPQELILEIFSWLPVKSLLRYKCVSKFYSSLVSESNFVDIHHRRSMIRPGGRKYLECINNVFYTTELKEDGKSFLFRIENFDQLHGYLSASSLMGVNGLVCAWRDKHHVAICNSSTREVRFLRCPKEFINKDYGYPICSIGFEPEEKKYKLWLTSDSYTRNWLFTIGIDKSWRETNCNARFSPSLYRVCVSGVIYVLGSVNGTSGIVAFDVRAEIFRILNFPHALHYSGYHDYNLIELKGKLAVLNYKKYSSEDVHLWILGKAQNDDWDRHIIRFPSQWKGIYRPESYFHFICASCDEEIVFISITKSRDWICICYDFTRKSWREFRAIEKLGERYWLSHILCYVENLSSLGKLCSTNLQD
ncbi:F-box protein At5g65850-like [Lycium ferocissimum]|uniref:F-box protein At5g65850-like n=1 Tax=Lycium ferocissimum TaxID=112874 RepID=UPI00281631B1|nr:F-box protein At5g65850-like [Lycium ferocissimum]